jgi:hypothetical protein
MRRYFVQIAVLFGILALAARADDFWVSKNWKDWSKQETDKMLQDSPWARPLIEDVSGLVETPTGPANNAATRRASSDFTPQTYYIQLRSALPERKAFIRQQQFALNYNQMPAAQKQAFDAQAGQILARTFDQTIVVHVVYTSKNAQGDVSPDGLLKMIEAWQALPQNYATDNFYLQPQHGSRVAAVRWVLPSKGVPEFEIDFPRLQNGEPIIQNSDKQFTVEMRIPPIGTDPVYGAQVVFDLGKMKVDGQPVF